MPTSVQLNHYVLHLIDPFIDDYKDIPRTARTKFPFITDCGQFAVSDAVLLSTHSSHLRRSKQVRTVTGTLYPHTRIAQSIVYWSLLKCHLGRRARTKFRTFYYD